MIPDQKTRDNLTRLPLSNPIILILKAPLIIGFITNWNLQVNKI